jgi:soluble lytic murein transglycosylase-like protein
MLSWTTVLRMACLTVLAMLVAVPAHAELVFFTSGRTMSVKAHRVEAETMILLLRTGGEIVFDRSLVAKVEQDEVPYPEPEFPADAVADTASLIPDLDPSSLQQVPYGDLIDSIAQAEGVDAMLVRALIRVESAFNAAARSRKGAMGLMQLMPVTARQYDIRDPYDPKSNIEGGVRHLKALLSRFDVKLALAAYNAGEGAVQKFQGIPPYPETREYVGRIMKLIGGGQALRLKPMV